jgi:hypothetical protein
MPKKPELSAEEYEIYKKTHRYDDVLEAEEGKINREKNNYIKLQRKSKARLKQSMQNLAEPEMLDELEADQDLIEDEHKTMRELQNARTHKRRLIGLRKHVDKDPLEGEGID